MDEGGPDHDFGTSVGGHSSDGGHAGNEGFGEASDAVGRPIGEASDENDTPIGWTMPTRLALEFQRELDGIYTSLLTIPQELADAQWQDGGWTRKQVLGHMLDSATNNRQRFVRAATEGSFAGPNYSQDGWVAAHGYCDQPWETLLRWWKVEHEILAAVVDRIPEERLAANCIVGDDGAVTLRFLIEDYTKHQRHHLRQLQSRSS